MRTALILGLLLGLASPALAQQAAPAQLSKLTLHDAILRALAASPRLDASRAGIAAATGSEQQTHLLPNPELGVEAENFAGSGPYSGFGGSELTYTASQFIELGGKREARQQAAAAERRAAETDLDAARLDLVRDVTLAYMDIVAAEENLRLARDLEDTARKVLADVGRRVAAARDPLFQKSRAEVAFATASIARTRAQDMLAMARQKLGRYWRAPLAADAVASDAFFSAASPQPLASYEGLLAQTPDLKRYERLREAREADADLASAGMIPDIRASVGLRQFPGGNGAAVVAGVSLPIPVFNRNQGEIARAGAEVTRAAGARRQAEFERAQQLADVWTQWQSAWSEIEALKTRALTQAERAFKQALDGYRLGGFEYLDVLDTQRAFFETRAALIAALSRLQAARAHVARLTALSFTSDQAGTP